MIRAGERTISANLSKAVAAIGRRTRITAALRLAVPAIALAAFTWISLRFAVAASLASASLLLPAAILLAAGVVLAMLLRAALTPVPVASAVRELDRRAGARGRVIAAHELSSSDDPFAKLAVADASPAIVDACAKLAGLFPIAKPAAMSRALVLLALAPVSALALQDVSFSLWRSSPTAGPISAEDEVAAIERAPLPTLAWVMKETASLLSPLAAPKPKPTPVVIATPAPVKKRGDTIADPEKKKYFDKVLANANVDTVGEEVITRFTKELMSKQYETLVAEFMTNGVSSGAKYEAGGEDGKASNKGLPPGMKKDSGSSSGNTKPAIDPSKMKSEYLKNKDQQQELLGAMKENFDIYLKEFAAEMLKGMEEALEKALSEPALEGNKNVASSHLKGLPNAPGGLSEGHEPGPSPDGEGPSYKMKDGEGTPTMEGVADMQQALGGTAAGGTGAGAGNEGQNATAGGKSDGKATGERVDLGGTLDERLAVVDVVQRMSGGTDEIEESAAAEVVRKSTKAAEREAASAEEIPEEYRGAVEAYFKALVPAQQ